MSLLNKSLCLSEQVQESLNENQSLYNITYQERLLNISETLQTKEDHKIVLNLKYEDLEKAFQDFEIFSQQSENIENDFYQKFTGLTVQDDIKANIYMLENSSNKSQQSQNSKQNTQVSDLESILKKLKLKEDKKLNEKQQENHNEVLIRDKNIQFDTDKNQIENWLLIILIDVYLNTQYPYEKINSLKIHQKDQINETIFLRHDLDVQINQIKLKKNLTQKRNEENLKFVIHRGFKFLLKQLKNQKNIPLTGTKIGDEKYFYQFYFGKISKNKKIAIEKFYLPGSSLYVLITQKTTLTRCLNQNYLNLIFESIQFNQDFKDYLKFHFDSHVSQQLLKKLNKIQERIEQNQPLKALKNIWTMQEAQKAKQITQNILFFVHKIEPKQSKKIKKQKIKGQKFQQLLINNQKNQFIMKNVDWIDQSQIDLENCSPQELKQIVTRFLDQKKAKFQLGNSFGMTLGLKEQAQQIIKASTQKFQIQRVQNDNNKQYINYLLKSHTKQ